MGAGHAAAAEASTSWPQVLEAIEEDNLDEREETQQQSGQLPRIARMLPCAIKRRHTASDTAGGGGAHNRSPAGVKRARLVAGAKLARTIDSVEEATFASVADMDFAHDGACGEEKDVQHVVLTREEARAWARMVLAHARRAGWQAGAWPPPPSPVPLTVDDWTVALGSEASQLCMPLSAFASAAPCELATAAALRDVPLLLAGAGKWSTDANERVAQARRLADHVAANARVGSWTHVQVATLLRKCLDAAGPQERPLHDAARAFDRDVWLAWYASSAAM